MQTKHLESVLYWIVRIGVYCLPFTLLIVSSTLFFPYITGKNFFFRIIIEIIGAAWIGLVCINAKRYLPARTFVAVALFTLVVISFLSALFGVDFANSFWSNYERMEGVITYLHLLLLFLILAGTFRTKREWFSIFGVSIGVSVLLASYGLLEYAGLVNTFADSSRVISTLGNPLYVAAYLTFHIFLIMFLLPFVHARWLKGLLGILFIFELVIFFLTGSRGAFLGIIGGAGMMFLFWIFTVQGSKKKFAFGGILLFVLFVPIFFNLIGDVSFIKNNDVLSRFSNISLSDSTVQSRFTIWNMAFRAFLERPIVGWGVGNFIVPFAEYYDPRMYGNEPWFDRTHNMPLEWLASVGLLGFLSYLILIGTIFFAIFIARKTGIFKTRDALIFMGMLAAYLFQLLFVFDTLATYLMLILIAGFLSVVSSTSLEQWPQKRRASPTLPPMTGWRIPSIGGVFVISFLLVFFINVKPYSAAASLIDAFRAVGTGDNKVVKEHFEKALAKAKGTIGVPEIREHLARTVIGGVTANPQVLLHPDIKALADFAVVEMEKQAQEGSRRGHINVRYNLILGRLYEALGNAAGDRSFVEKALREYERALAAAPSYISLYPLMAETLLHLGEPARALEMVKKAEALLADAGKKSPDISYTIPLIFAATRDFEKSFSSLQSLALGSDGSYQALESDEVERLVRVARSAGGTGALSFIENVYTLNQRRDAFIALTLAEMYVEIGDREKARSFALEAKEKDPNVAGEVDSFLHSL